LKFFRKHFVKYSLFSHIQECSATKIIRLSQLYSEIPEHEQTNETHYTMVWEYRLTIAENI